MKLSRSLIISLTVVALLSGCGKKGTPTSVANLDTTPPPTPTSLQVVTDNQGRCTLSWEPSAAADLFGYEVYECLAGDDALTLTARVSSDLSAYTVAPTQQTTLKEYRVRAFDVTGNRSGYSGAVTAEVRPWNVAGEPGSRPNYHLEP